MARIYFDMDGTIADLYSVENWLPKLRAYDATPYIDAETLVDMRTLARTLNRLQKNGHQIGIITWTSKQSTPEYHHAVAEAKMRWLNRHLHSVNWDEIHIVEYGVPKSSFIPDDEISILFDDNAEVREDWTGLAFTEKDIMSVLRGMVK